MISRVARAALIIAEGRGRRGSEGVKHCFGKKYYCNLQQYRLQFTLIVILTTNIIALLRTRHRVV